MKKLKEVNPQSYVLINEELYIVDSNYRGVVECYKIGEDLHPLNRGLLQPDSNTLVQPVELIDIYPFEYIRENIGRAGHGKDGKGPYREAKLKDMNDEWVEASIDYVTDIHPHKKYYRMELNYRKEKKRKNIIKSIKEK